MGDRKTIAMLGFEELGSGTEERRLKGLSCRKKLEESGRSSFLRSMKFSLSLLLSLAFNL